MLWPGDLVLATVVPVEKKNKQIYQLLIGDVITLLLTGKIGKVHTSVFSHTMDEITAFFKSWSLVRSQTSCMFITFFSSKQFGRISRRRMDWVKYV